MVLLLGGDGGEADDQMRLFANLAQQGGGVFVGGVVAFKELARGHDDLVRRLAPAGAPAHAVGHYAQHAAGHARVGKQAELILLIVPVALVQACGGSEPEALVLVHVVRNVCLCI